MPTDIHIQLRRHSIQKLISTTRPPTGVRSDPLVFRFGFNDPLIPFFT
jgi:hypothetical protein